MQTECYLMDGQYDQAGARGILMLDDQGRLTFTLDQAAGTRGRLKWIEKALRQPGIHERVAAGDRIVVFDTAVAGKKLKWPWNFRGRAFRIEDDAGRRWLVSLVAPGGGLMFFLESGSGLPKKWKAALADKGAN